MVEGQCGWIFEIKLQVIAFCPFIRIYPNIWKFIPVGILGPRCHPTLSCLGASPALMFGCRPGVILRARVTGQFIIVALYRKKSFLWNGLVKK